MRERERESQSQRHRNRNWTCPSCQHIVLCKKKDRKEKPTGGEEKNRGGEVEVAAKTQDRARRKDNNKKHKSVN